MMENLRKIIKEEIDDFDWIRDVQVNTDLTPAQLYNRYGDITFNLSGQYIANQFNDLALEGDKIYLYTSGWEDFIDLFEDCNGGYNYICRDLARLILSEDEYWEPYYDIVSDWQNQVWDLVTDDEELLDYIKKYIKENGFIGQELESEEDPDMGGFREDMLLDDDLLGELIETEPMFEDLKRELSWAYENSYNTAARDNVWKAAYEAIKDLFGEGKWITINNPNGRNISKIKFNVTDLVIDSIKESVEMCFDDCNRYWNEERHYDPEDTEFNSVEEAYEDYCDCNDKPFEDYSYFLDFLSYHLYETSEQLNPRYDEYPDSDEIVEYMKEDIYGRF